MACLERLVESGDTLSLEAAAIILGLEQSLMLERALPRLFDWDE